MTQSRNTIDAMYRAAILMLTLATSAAVSAATTTPDLSGPWQVIDAPHALRTVDGKAPPLKPEAETLYRRNQAALQTGDHAVDTMQECVPPGVPRLQLQNFAWQIVQGKRIYGFVFEWNHLNRLVYMTEGHFEGIGPTYLGQSVGRWEGATLVIDTDSYNDKTLLDDSGLPHSDQLHTLERYRLIDSGKKLELRLTITDPQIYAAPWDTVITFAKKPGVILKEDYCLGRTGQTTGASK